MKAIHYVDNVTEIAKNLTIPHTVFTVHGHPKTVMTQTDLFKDVSGFGDRATAYECLYLWKQAGFSGSPSSPVAFFRNVCKVKTNIKAGTNDALSRYFSGGWISALSSGFHHGEAYLYDIVKAYYWAGSLGLPMKVKYFKNKPTSKNWIAIVKMKSHPEVCPDFLKREVAVLSSEDIEVYDCEFDILYGFDLYGFDYFPQQDLEKIDYLPEKCLKLAKQSYWGIWAMQQQIRVERITNDGEVINWHLNNRNKKMIWAILIVRRVMGKLYSMIDENVMNIYVDSILTREKIADDKTGEEAGDWKLKKTLDGVVIKNAGVWTTIDSFLKHGKRYENWYKHSGYRK